MGIPGIYGWKDPTKFRLVIDLKTLNTMVEETALDLPDFNM